MPKAIPTVTAEQLAHLVGARLKARRLALHWTVSDVQAKGGPTYHTVQKIEAGAQAGIDVLERHITALGLTLREVFTAALTPPGVSSGCSAVTPAKWRGSTTRPRPKGKRLCFQWHEP